jgi:hypothetical protein
LKSDLPSGEVEAAEHDNAHKRQAGPGSLHPKDDAVRKKRYESYIEAFSKSYTREYWRHNAFLDHTTEAHP